LAYTYKYPRPALTVDAAVFRERKGLLKILLIQRDKPPFEGKWALPGGFVDMDETLEEAIARELEEETSLKNLELKQLHAFSAPGRDPRGHTISVVFMGILTSGQQVKAGDDARNAKWFAIDQLPDLAFDHDDIVNLAINKFNN
jgi:8-oxo-dGTP diphosphatase